MVWQLLVLPGAQTVTETKGVLTLAMPLAVEGPASTVIIATFAPVGMGGCVGMVDVPELPPHPTTLKITAIGASAIDLVITPSLLNVGDGHILRQELWNVSPAEVRMHSTA